MTVKDITSKLEEWAPLVYQESYDNCGLLIGNQDQKITHVLITLDVTEDVIDEAIQTNCHLIVAHHPLIFGGVNKITPNHWVGRCITKAIKYDICIYAIHTNLDNIISGVNSKIAEKLELHDVEILWPKENTLIKLVTYAPSANVQEVLKALYSAGAGNIGQYDKCSFAVNGVGTFRPSEGSNPTIGTQGKEESVNEIRIEILVPIHLQSDIICALKIAHPYEEVAYDLIPLKNHSQAVGSGIIGNLPAAIEVMDFLKNLKCRLHLPIIRHTPPARKNVQKIAVCGGSGSFLLTQAIRKHADVFVTADVKYHDFFEANSQLLMADIGHYQSEVGTKELIYDYLNQKFTNIAFRLSDVKTDPIIYT